MKFSNSIDSSFQRWRQPISGKRLIIYSLSPSLRNFNQNSNNLIYPYKSRTCHSGHEYMHSSSFTRWRVTSLSQNFILHVSILHKSKNWRFSKIAQAIINHSKIVWTFLFEQKHSDSNWNFANDWKTFSLKPRCIDYNPWTVWEYSHFHKEIWRQRFWKICLLCIICMWLCVHPWLSWCIPLSIKRHNNCKF